jgi:outer membrane protein
MKKLLAAAFILTFLTAGKTGMSQQKFGVINTNEVFSMMAETKKADSLLESFQKAITEDYTISQSELNAAYEKFVKDSAKMAPSLKEIKRTDLQNRITELSRKEKQSNGLVEAEREKLIKPIRDKLLVAIKEVAKENGYSHIAYKEQMIVFPSADDITDKVKKKLGVK